ncbi:hypothetical protein K474DRAFT_716264 [Panus rudis PR-1116 ss-1]|nr:hypothetical protein K474DRAFT_716264 [Panus rudis PR-1116 ss-1]
MARALRDKANLVGFSYAYKQQKDEIHTCQVGMILNFYRIPHFPVAPVFGEETSSLALKAALCHTLRMRTLCTTFEVEVDLAAVEDFLRVHHLCSYQDFDCSEHCGFTNPNLLRPNWRKGGSCNANRRQCFAPWVEGWFQRRHHVTSLEPIGNGLEHIASTGTLDVLS